jgi:excinuclease ABC subunit C
MDNSQDIEGRPVELLGYGWGEGEAQRSPHLLEKLSHLPDSPGVYLHKDKAGRVLYVGKARSLKSRVRSYFHQGAAHSPRIAWMVSRVHDVEFFLVTSNLEALILECNLIKKYRPYFNVKYRDDKRYPLLEITTSEEFPKVRVVRQARNKKNRYFGPYPDAGAMRRTLKVIQKVFQVRTCKVAMDRVAERPCLDYHIELCTAPCTRYVDQLAYRSQIDAAIDFLEGRSERLIARLTEDMRRYAETLDFERCARLRDTLADVSRMVEKQSVVSSNPRDHEDYIGLVSRRDTVAVHLLMVRAGKLIEQKSFFLDSHGGAEEAEQMSAFLKEHYDNPVALPRRLLVSALPEDHEVLEDWLSDKAGHRVEIRLAQRGEKRKLLDLCLKNARQALEMETVMPSRYESRRSGLAELQEQLSLAAPPWRIECVDISNSHGKEAVGSLVVFEQGMPKKSEYRKFRITSGDTPDDFRMMHEVLTRRFRNDGKGGNYEALPDLLVVDGGKGQLSSASRAIEEMGLTGKVPVVGLAKQHEWLYAPGQSEPIVLPPGSKGLSLVTHLRDEAHRFAITYHRGLRAKASARSVLDDAPGVGPVKKKLLMEHFKTVRRLMAASPEEIARLEGFGLARAQSLHSYLHGSAAPANVR